MNLPFWPAFQTPVKSPIHPTTHAWKYSAALHLGLSVGEARSFADTGILRLPGLTIHLQPWCDEPVPHWLALGLVSRPDDVPARLWNELLLRSNCAISAMSACTAAIDERGDTVLVNRLAARPGSETICLSEELALLIALAESLIGGATSFSVGQNRTDTLAASPAAPGIPLQVSNQTSLTLDWHQSLLTDAMHHLGSTKPLNNVETVGVIRIGAQQLEIIADSDERHVLVSSNIANRLRSDAQRILALRANLELMILTGCTVALTPHGACLQARWNSQGLDGRALGDWLGDFAQLAGSIGTNPTPSSTKRSRP